MKRYVQIWPIKGCGWGQGQWFQRKVWPDGLDLTVIPKARSLAIKCWWQSPQEVMLGLSLQKWGISGKWGERLPKNLSLAPSSGISLLFQVQVQPIVLTYRSFIMWAMPTVAPSLLPLSPPHLPPPVLTLRTFPLCSNKPLYMSLCLPGLHYFISFL